MEVGQLIAKGSFELQENFQTQRLMRAKNAQELGKMATLSKKVEKQKKGTMSENFMQEVFQILNSPRDVTSEKAGRIFLSLLRCITPDFLFVVSFKVFWSILEERNSPNRKQKSCALVLNNNNNYMQLSGIERGKIDSLFNIYDRICTIVANCGQDENTYNGGFGDTGTSSSVVALPPVNSNPRSNSVELVRLRFFQMSECICNLH